MTGQIFLGILGFAAGVIAAGGVATLMVGLGILTRFIAITDTAEQISYYENAIFAGTIAGNLITICSFSFSMNGWWLGIGGLFMGIFVGGWILTLAEVIDVFPVCFRRLGILHGIRWIIYALAVGKITGSMLYFYHRW